MYKDLETGDIYYQKRKADKLYKKGHKIRVYDKDPRTKQMIPICELIVDSSDHFVFTENGKDLISYGGKH